MREAAEDRGRQAVRLGRHLLDLVGLQPEDSALIGRENFIQRLVYRGEVVDAAGKLGDGARLSVRLVDARRSQRACNRLFPRRPFPLDPRSEEHTSELQTLTPIT